MHADSLPAGRPAGLPAHLPAVHAVLCLAAEMVIFEAARAICNMRDVTTRELTPAVTVLQLFLSSSKPIMRFAAVRTLNKVCTADNALSVYQLSP
jgi:hypothetical protein